MAAFNQVLLMGNVTRDIQLSYTPNNTAVADFGIAVNRKWKGQNGEAKEEVCFVDCRAFGKTAEVLNQYIHKGDPIFIQGRLTFDSWTAQDGTKRSKHRVVVNSFQFLPKAALQTNQQGQQSQGNGNSHQKPPQQQQREPGWDDYGPPPSDDEIPFD